MGPEQETLILFGRAEKASGRADIFPVPTGCAGDENRGHRGQQAEPRHGPEDAVLPLDRYLAGLGREVAGSRGKVRLRQQIHIQLHGPRGPEAILWLYGQFFFMYDRPMPWYTQEHKTSSKFGHGKPSELAKRSTYLSYRCLNLKTLEVQS